jgi:hypothetical protein
MRIVSGAIVVLLTLPLLVGGCSSSGSDGGGDNGGSEESSGMPSRDEMFGYLREEASGSGISTEELDCLLAGMDALNDEQLFSILEDTASEDVQQQVSTIYAACGSTGP